MNYLNLERTLFYYLGRHILQNNNFYLVHRLSYLYYFKNYLIRSNGELGFVLPPIRNYGQQ
jgi:hypothetical protein